MIGIDRCTQGVCLHRGPAQDQQVNVGAELLLAIGNGKPISVESVWHKVREEAGLRDVRLHDLRHSYASHGARLQLPMPVLQNLLGHSEIGSTANYTHFNDEHLFEIANGISALIDAAISGRRR